MCWGFLVQKKEGRDDDLISSYVDGLFTSRYILLLPFVFSKRE
jgi:hypothetical protein